MQAQWLHELEKQLFFSVHRLFQLDASYDRLCPATLSVYSLAKIGIYPWCSLLITQSRSVTMHETCKHNTLSKAIRSSK